MQKLIQWVKALFNAEELAAAKAEVDDLAKSLRNGQANQERLLKLWEESERAAITQTVKLREATRPFPVEDLEESLPWTASEVAAWRQFLKSPAGELMLRQAGHLEQRANAKACRRTDPDANVFANNAGYARGWSDATRYFFRSLTVDVPPAAQRSSEEDEATESAKGAADIRERLAP